MGLGFRSEAGSSFEESQGEVRRFEVLGQMVKGFVACQGIEAGPSFEESQGEVRGFEGLGNQRWVLTSHFTSASGLARLKCIC